MTLSDVIQQILDRNDEDMSAYSENPSLFIGAINMAMREITNIFPLIGEYRIAQNPLPNLLPNARESGDAKHYDGRVPVTYAAQGAKSLYFECSGTGRLTVQEDGDVRVIKLASDRVYKEYREFVNGSVALTFDGEYSYDIKNIAVYGELFSDRISDIPAHRRYARYDFKELTAVNGVPVFIDFLGKVQEGDTSGGKAYLDIKDFQTERRHVLVLNGFEKAQYTVFYNRNFTPITGDTPPDEFEIELDPDKEHLLPLLAAYYVWIGDNRPIAIQCQNDYEDYKNNLLAQAKPQTATEPFVNDLGW